MNRRNWLWAALLGLPIAVIGGLANANNPQASSYVCPVTGETLPCEKCCPLNKALTEPQVKIEAKTETTTEAQPYICPITGEELGCSGCCPLNQSDSKTN